MTRTVSYRWHLRQIMAGKGMFATTELGPLLAARGIVLSREQVYRLVTSTPERLNLTTFAALCDSLDVTPADLLEDHGRARKSCSGGESHHTCWKGRPATAAGPHRAQRSRRGS